MVHPNRAERLATIVDLDPEGAFPRDGAENQAPLAVPRGRPGHKVRAPRNLARYVNDGFIEERNRTPGNQLLRVIRVRSDHGRTRRVQVDQKKVSVDRASGRVVDEYPGGWNPST